MATVFETLNAINVNEHTETKKADGTELTYLSWTWAWSEVKKAYPNAKYEVWKNANGLPYSYDEETGYMVFTSVTIDDVTHEMWLPVMDSKNKAMKSKPYTYKTKWGEKSVESATMFDINKAIMRCLTKNLAMFGLGLYIYSGEDLPESEPKEEDKPKASNKNADSKKFIMCGDCGKPIVDIVVGGKEWGRKVIAESTMKTYGRCLCWDCASKEKEKVKKDA